MTPKQANAIQQIELLPSQIAQFVQQLESFLETLQSESQALKSDQPDQLSSILSIKSVLAEEISRLTQTIEKQLNTQKLTLPDLLSSKRPSNLPQAMQHNIQQLITLSNQCHDLNQANGISIQVLNNINRHTLKILSGQEFSNVKLYGATGETQTSASTKNPLGKA